MAKILVTGGMGFIGTNLVNELRGRGHEVWVCDLVQGPGAQDVRCDVREYRQLERLFNGRTYDYVYHLAAEYGRWNGEDHYENLWETNVIGTKNVVRLQEQHRFRLIFFSSAEMYGDYDGVMSEDVMDRIAIKQMNDYAMTKWVGEMQVLNSHEMFGTETVRVRPVNAYGPHESYSRYRGVIPMFIHKALHDEPYTVYLGHQRIFDYVEDTCRTFANIVDNFVPGEVYNVGSREDWEHDIKYVSDLILKATGRTDAKVTYKQGEPFTTRVKHMDFSKIRRDLSHDPKVALEEGIARTVAWTRKEYRLS
jgi:dTDP-glucose 4,6-dehydratase